MILLGKLLALLLYGIAGLGVAMSIAMLLLIFDAALTSWGNR
jgi:hypothetical protein